MLQVCAQNAQCVCVCARANACEHCTEFAALCSKGRKSQDDGDFKTGLQLLRKPVHCMFSFLRLSVAPLMIAFCSRRSFEKSYLISGYTDYPWKHNSMTDASVCDQLYE